MYYRLLKYFHRFHEMIPHSILIKQKFKPTKQPYSPDTCTGMMIENFLSTKASYPITYGTAITVACDPQYDLLGSEIITCEWGKVYSHSSRRPKCVSKGKQCR